MDTKTISNEGTALSGRAGSPIVRHFREILVWPLQLEPLAREQQVQRHWELLPQAPGGTIWSEVVDEFGCDPRDFAERHYSEFVTFLPAVQRFLYGEGADEAVHGSPIPSSIRTFRRRDIAAFRITPREEMAPVVLQVQHVDLVFFEDVDVVMLSVEVHAEDLPLEIAQEILFRFGRAYPPGWEEGARGATCAHRTELLGHGGEVLAASDFGDRSTYLQFVGRHRAPRIASHWAHVMAPLVLHGSDQVGRLRYRQLEYYRMPVMAYLAVDEPWRLTRADYVRLALVTGPGDSAALPFSERYLARFERRFCYDRHNRTGMADPNDTRTLTCGHDFVTVGHAASPFFTDPETGFLAQFRHQYFLLFMIAHLHKASLLMLSSRLAWAIQALDIEDVASVRAFKRTIRQVHEIFLRFTHRYWFHEVSIQVQAREIFAMLAEHLGTDALYRDLREEVLDMSQYLDSDNVRRQANVVVRLTVITIVGLIGTTATGFLGMNLVAEADKPLGTKVAYFLGVFLPVTLLLLYTVMKSKRLSDFMEVLSDERVGLRAKARALAGVWTRPR